MISVETRFARLEKMLFTLVDREARADKLQGDLDAAHERIRELASEMQARDDFRPGDEKPTSIAREWYRRGYLAGRSAARRGESIPADEACERSRALRRVA